MMYMKKGHQIKRLAGLGLRNRSVTAADSSEVMKQQQKPSDMIDDVRPNHSKIKSSLKTKNRKMVVNHTGSVDLMDESPTHWTSSETTSPVSRRKRKMASSKINRWGGTQRVDETQASSSLVIFTEESTEDMGIDSRRRSSVWNSISDACERRQNESLEELDEDFENGSCIEEDSCSSGESNWKQEFVCSENAAWEGSIASLKEDAAYGDCCIMYCAKKPKISTTYFTENQPNRARKQSAPEKAREPASFRRRSGELGEGESLLMYSTGELKKKLSDKKCLRKKQMIRVGDGRGSYTKTKSLETSTVKGKHFAWNSLRSLSAAKQGLVTLTNEDAGVQSRRLNSRMAEKVSKKAVPEKELKYSNEKGGDLQNDGKAWDGISQKRIKEKENKCFSHDLFIDSSPHCGVRLRTINKIKRPFQVYATGKKQQQRGLLPIFALLTLMNLETGELVWGKLAGYRWWPAVVISGTLLGLPAVAGKVWLFWLGDEKISQILVNKVTCFHKTFESRLGKQCVGVFRKAVLEALKICADRAGFGETAGYDALISWAKTWSQNIESACPFAPDKDNPIPELILHKLAEQNRQIEREIKVMSEHVQESVMITQDKGKGLNEVKAGKLDIRDICISCKSSNLVIVTQHPLFEGGLCQSCKNEISETAFAVTDDGSHAFCSVCGSAGKLYICESADCGRVYCVHCTETFLSPSAVKKLVATNSWICFLCSKYSPNTHGKLIPKSDWQQNFIKFFDSGFRVKKPDLSHLFVGNKRQSLRVLSLFDGIGTAKLVLDQLGLNVEVYYASEIDDNAMTVTKMHHGNSVIQLGDIRKLDEERLAEICPLHLVLGGSPCNELSLVNPARKGFSEEGSGWLFLEFYRVLSLIQKLSPDQHVFWLYENVASMKKNCKHIISRFLGCEPSMWDAQYFSAQKRARYFWGNIMGMYELTFVSSKQRSTKLESMLFKNCNRKANVDKIRTVTTRTNSLMQTKSKTSFPVTMNGQYDTIWVTELEQIFGFPAHYTDVFNLNVTKRRLLLGKAWSVPVIRHLLTPLKDLFAIRGGRSPLSPSLTSFVLENFEEY